MSYCATCVRWSGALNAASIGVCIVLAVCNAGVAAAPPRPMPKAQDAIDKGERSDSEKLLVFGRMAELAAKIKSVRDDPEKEELREVLVAVGQQYVGGLGRDYHISVCH